MTPSRLALTYGAAGAAWILISDLFAVGSGYWGGAAKGVGYVTVTATLLYVLLKRYQADIDRQKQSALDNAARFQTLVESAPVGLFVQSGGVFRYLNPAAMRLLGASDASELIGHPVFGRFQPASHGEVRKCLEEIAHQRTCAAPALARCAALDGRSFDAEVTAVPFNHAGEPGALVYLADISERTSRERVFRALAETMPAAAWIADENGGVVFLNERWYEYTGHPRGPQALRRWTDAVHPEDIDRVLRTWANARDSQTLYEVRLRYRRHDGEYRWYVARALPITASEGRVVNWFGISTDVDEPVRLIEHLEAAAEKERIRLARELHDDFGQLLAAAKLNVELSLHNGTDIETRLGRALADLQACMQRTRNMAMMMRPPELEHGGLIAALRGQAHDFESSAGIACIFRSNAESVALAYPSALAIYRIVQEALTNAAKHSGATEVHIDVCVSSDTMRTTVADNGRGFYAHTAARVHGLGLVGMKERALSAGMVLAVDSGSQGTRVQVDTPLPSAARSSAATRGYGC